MNLVRLGHYFVPTNWAPELQLPDDGRCETALVCGVFSDGPGEEANAVNLRVWDKFATDRRENGVAIAEPAPAGTEPSFHLSGDCPWKR